MHVRHVKNSQSLRWLTMLLIAVLAAGVLAACGGGGDAPAPEEAAPAEEAAAPAEEAAAEADAGEMADSHEAPAFAEMVAAGELPPLEERMPTNPVVVEPVDSLGKYGGTWRAGLRGGSDNAWVFRTIGYEPMVTWTRDWAEIEPNVAESWEVNEDATEYTFHLREGMKWSDGEPFTADDILFWYNDIVLNEEITPSVPNWLKSGDTPVVIEKIDDTTVKWTFAEPNGVLLLRLASADGQEPTNAPAHWLQQFHADYNDNVVADAEAAGYDDWVSYFQAMWGGGCCNYIATDASRPVLWGWKIDAAYGENTTSVRTSRNPYYWKVDTAGNQLPYIDEVLYNVGNDVEVLVLQALNGEIDYQDRHIATFNNKAVFFDNMEQGDYILSNKLAADNNVMEISLNLNHQDEALNEIFNNKDFRVGLSHAINRQEIIDLVYVGQGQPSQAAPLPSSPYYVERLATQYLDYDLDLANEHLDAAGLSERDADGFRLRPDGERLSFTIDVPTVNTEHIDMLQLVEGYWAEVGVEMKPNVLDRSLGQTRLEALEHDGNVWGAPGGIGFGTLLDPRNWIPMHGHSRYGYAWYLWYTNPDNELAQEPPEIVREQLALYDQIQTEADPAVQTELMKQILETAADNFFMIGIATPAPQYAVVNKDLRNVMDQMPGAWQYPTPAPSDPFQWYFDR